VAILTTTTALIHMALVIFLAGNIKEVGLAVEGPPMGDVHPGNMIASVVTFMFFVISFLYLLSYPGRSA
jgi:hypothetical protein